MTVSPQPADFRPASPVQGTHSVIERNWNELIRPEKPQIESGADGQRTHTNARTRKGPAKPIAGKKK